MQQWEYLEVDLNSSNRLGKLAELGEAGWELVAVANFGPVNTRYYF